MTSERLVVFSRVHSVSSTNNTYRHDIAETLLKVAVNTIKPKTLTCNQSSTKGASCGTGAANSLVLSGVQVVQSVLLYTVKPANAVTSITQSPVLKGHLFLVLS
jgi:hypothetical protein